MRYLSKSFFTVVFVAAMINMPSKITWAQGDVNLLTMPANQTLLNISATERTRIEQDLLTASLRIELEGQDPVALQNEINTRMERALSAARAVPGLEVSTGHYYVYQYDRAPPRPLENSEQPQNRRWRGGQSLEVMGTDADAILRLSGDLQALGLIMSSLNYSLSPARADETRDNLMEAALQRVTARAERAAAALGKADTRLVEITVDTDSMPHPPQMMMRSMAMESAADMATPSAAPGMTDITLTVSARALLQ